MIKPNENIRLVAEQQAAALSAADTGSYEGRKAVLQPLYKALEEKSEQIKNPTDNTILGRMNRLMKAAEFAVDSSTAKGWQPIKGSISEAYRAVLSRSTEALTEQDFRDFQIEVHTILHDHKISTPFTIPKEYSHKDLDYFNLVMDNKSGLKIKIKNEFGISGELDGALLVMLLHIDRELDRNLNLKAADKKNIKKEAGEKAKNLHYAMQAEEEPISREQATAELGKAVTSLVLVQKNPRGTILPADTTFVAADSITCSYQKRMLSFVHGFIIAAHRYIEDDAVRKVAIESAMQQYTAEIDSKETLDPDDFKEFSDRLMSLAVGNGISATELNKAEYYANVERGRSEIHVVTHGANISETPVDASVSEAFQDEMQALKVYIAAGEPSPVAMPNNKQFKEMDYVERENLGEALALRKNGLERLQIGNEVAALKASPADLDSKRSTKVHKDEVYTIQDEEGVEVFKGTLDELTQVRQYFVAEANAGTPTWFVEMSLVEKQWWRENIDGVIKGDVPLPSMPATARNVPIPANYLRHDYQSDKMRGVDIRLGVATAYEVNDEKGKKHATEVIGKTVVEGVEQTAKAFQETTWGAAILNEGPMPLMGYITFLTPHEQIHQKRGLGSVDDAREKPFSKLYQYAGHWSAKHNKKAREGLEKAEDNRAMILMAQAGMSEAVEGRAIAYIPINFALNMARDNKASFGSKDDLASLKEVNRAFESYQSAVISARVSEKPEVGEEGIFRDKKAKTGYQCAQEALSKLNDLFNDYNKDWKNIPKEKRSVYNQTNPELYAACYTSLVLQGLGGVPANSCKSAKDRDGMFHIYQDAMRIYYERHGKLPSPDDIVNDPAAYTEFMDIAADVYLTAYSQEVANQNSYGAAGLKEGGDLGASLATTLDAKLKGKLSIGEATKFQAKGFVDAVERKKPGLFKAEQKLAGTNKVKPGKKLKQLEKDKQKIQAAASHRTILTRGRKPNVEAKVEAKDRPAEAPVVAVKAPLSAPASTPSAVVASPAAAEITKPRPVTPDPAEETARPVEPKTNALSIAAAKSPAPGEGPRTTIAEKPTEQQATYAARVGTPVQGETQITLVPDYLSAMSHSKNYDWLKDEAEIVLAANKQSVNVHLKVDTVSDVHKYDLALLAVTEYLQKSGNADKPLYLGGADEELVRVAVQVCTEYGVDFKVRADQPNREAILQSAQSIETTHKMTELTQAAVPGGPNLAV